MKDACLVLSATRVLGLAFLLSHTAPGLSDDWKADATPSAKLNPPPTLAAAPNQAAISNPGHERGAVSTSHEEMKQVTIQMPRSEPRNTRNTRKSVEWSGGATAGFSRVLHVAPSFPPEQGLRQNWPCFRGTEGGLAAWTNVPLQFDVRSGAGVVWRAAVPAPGHNSPIVWGDRVFLSGGDKTSRAVFCFHAVKGDLLWQRALDLPRPPGSQEWEVPESAGMAAPTMVADGRRAYAIFANGDLAAFDFEGQKVWAKNLGLPDNPYGHTASLALWRNRLIVQMDQGVPDDHKARLFAFDSATGQLMWEKQRPVGSSWSSPIIAEASGKAQILTLAVPWAIAYDAQDGSELWRLGEMSGEVTPSPIFAAGLFFVISPSEALRAIRPDGQGDITKTHVAWSSDEWVPDICSPVSNGEFLFTMTTSGTLTCFDARNGKKQGDRDFEMEFRASPSIAGNRLYLLESTGKVIVLEVNRQFKELARSDLAEAVYGCGHASIVIAEVGGIRQYVTLVGSKQIGMIGVNAANGKFLWNYKGVMAVEGHGCIPTPLVQGDLVFISGAYQGGASLVRLVPDGAGGIQAHEVFHLKGHELQVMHGGMVWVDGHIYGGHGHNGGSPFCLDVRTGKLAWKERGAGFGSAGLVYADGHLYFRYEDNVLALVEATPKGYHLRSKFQIGTGNPTYRERNSATNRELPGDLDTGWPHPVVVHGRLYIRAKNKVLCYDIRQSAVSQKHTAGEALAAFGDAAASEKSTHSAELSLLIPPPGR